MPNQKLTLEFISEYFQSQNCELLESTYKDCKTKMRYKCQCGNISEICYKEFKRGRRCKKCGGNEKLTIEFVTEYFKSQNCELLETEYKNSSTLMKYKCDCGELSAIRWDDFKKGVRCDACRAKRIVETRDKNQSHWAITGVYSPPTNQVNLICQQLGASQK
jgi:DNA-directed RNA polymerase subunit RPC12/RpoP